MDTCIHTRVLKHFVGCLGGDLSSHPDRPINRIVAHPNLASVSQSETQSSHGASFGPTCA